MSIIIQKYGGSSVATIEKLEAIADRVVKKHAEGYGVVVVVSAMGNTTDELLKLSAKITTTPPARELDMLLSTGERTTMALLSIAIQKRGAESISFTGSQSGIITTDSHSHARIISVRPYRIQDELERGNTIRGVADPAIWDESRGRDGTIIRMMESEGIYFEKGRHDRLSGKMQCHYRMAFDDDERPMMYVFKSCRPFLSTVPNLIYDINNVEDIDTTQEDHDYDAMRYFFMANPISPPAPKPAEERVWSPLDIM